MQIEYNIYIELASIVYVLILCIYQKIQYSNQLEVNRTYERLAWTVFAALCMDVTTAVTISYADYMPVWFNLLINTAYFELDAMIAFFFVSYVAAYIYTKEEHYKIMRLNHILHAAYLCLLLINLATGWIFRFEGHDYVHGSFYNIVFIMPFYYLIFSVAILIKNWTKFQKKQQIAILFFIFFVGVGPMIQLFFMPKTLISLFSATIGLSIIHYSLETPDYHRLMLTMEELTATKEEALKANQVKSEFLANMSHELRTPTNAILGFNEILMKETKESHTAEYALKVQSAGRILTSIMNDIIDFTSINDGNLRLEIKPYDAMSLMQDMITYAKYFAKEKNLECRLSVDGAIPQTLSGDAVRLMQIMNNLIANAVKFTQKGHIEFVVEWKPLQQKTGMLCVRVSDSGIGIKQEGIERLGKLGKVENGFLRLDDRKTRNVQGIGLGLTIVNRLLALMDSHLEIASEYGKGSDFSFQVLQGIVNEATIGKLDEIIGDTDPISQNKTTLYAPKVKMLVVDDNVMNRDMFKGLLRHSGIQIDAAENGAEALRLLELNRYHMVFLDHMMPVLDGMETLQEMKKRGLCEETTVIALTANAVPGAKESYLAAGFEDYLSKPVKGLQLESMIQQYLPEELLEQKQEESTSSSQTQPETPIIEKGFLARLTCLDTDVGMTYCCENEEFYREMIGSYLNNRRDEELADFYEHEYWGNYRISVHALKSTSLSIGATEVSEQAKALEMAAKENDIAFIIENHDKMMKLYQKLLSQLESVMNGQEIEPVAQTSAQNESLHIFAVDDDNMNLQIIEKMLSSEFSVTCFDSGDKMLTALSTEIPDMILLDVRMPQMDGFAVLQQLKKHDEYKMIPVIFLTADEDSKTEIKGFKEGVLDFIRKPFVAEIMIERVKRIMQLDSLQKDLQVEVKKQTAEIVEQREQVERLTMEVIQTLAGAIDAKDKYTNGHSIRVAEYARALARRLGKSETVINDIYVTGLLHDVGKIGIPDEIINKPDKLTDAEYAIIKTHPAIGAHILCNISSMPDIAIGAHWHHERYDGRGYPDGLKGTDIPEMARIIGVADAYDAMASIRSYRGVLPQEVVMSELKKGRGTQFDPKIADAMIALMEEDVNYQLREHKEN